MVSLEVWNWNLYPNIWCLALEFLLSNHRNCKRLNRRIPNIYVYICHPRNQRPRKKVCFRIHQHSFLWKHFKENMPVAFRLSQKGQSLIWPLPRGWTKRFGASLLIWILKFRYYYFFQNISLGSILDCSFTWHIEIDTKILKKSLTVS